MNEILLTGLAVAVIVMIALDVIEKVNDYRVKKVEKKIVEPRVTRRPCNPYPLKAKIVNPNGMDEYQIKAKLANIIMDQILAHNLMDIYVYDDLEHYERCVEATLRVIKPEDKEEIS